MQMNQNNALTEAVYYILLSIQTPLHGYGIMQNIEKLSGGRVRLAAGTLYGAISTMLEKGWISAMAKEKDSRKKEYRITVLGREIMQAEMCRLEELLKNGKAHADSRQYIELYLSRIATLLGVFCILNIVIGISNIIMFFGACVYF